MSELELTMRLLDVKWIGLKIYDEKNIAIGCYCHNKGSLMRKQKRPIEVVAYTFVVGPFGEEITNPVPGTKRKFRKSEKKIAQWYFRELCQLLKNGILQVTTENKIPSFGKWD